MMCEIGLVQGEIRWMKQHLGRLCRQKHVRTPLAQFAAKSYQSPSPYGNVLIMSPWNYPVLLTLEPLVDAIAAGNTAVVKPSAYAPASANVLKDLLEECFPPEYVTVVLGGREENQVLLQEKFDKIFFHRKRSIVDKKTWMDFPIRYQPYTAKKLKLIRIFLLQHTIQGIDISKKIRYKRG